MKKFKEYMHAIAIILCFLMLVAILDFRDCEIEVNKDEKAYNDAKSAIKFLLVDIEQPKSREQAIELMDEWGNTSLKDLQEAKDYNLERVTWANPALVRSVNYCLARVERVKAERKRE